MYCLSHLPLQVSAVPINRSCQSSILTSAYCSDFGALLTGGGGGGDGAGGGSDVAGPFSDPTFITIFAISWFLVVVIVVAAVVFIVAVYTVRYALTWLVLYLLQSYVVTTF